MDQTLIKKVAAAVARCRERGLRRTKALEVILQVLTDRARPMTLAELAASAELEGQCDKATIYRLLVRLDQHGIVRRVGLHERSAYYAIIHPGEHFDYLVCTTCGTIDQIDLPCPLGALEKEITQKFGYTQVYHELEFFGVCGTCGAA